MSRWMLFALYLIISVCASAQQPIVHLRADSLVTVNQNERIPEIRSVVGNAIFVADTAYSAPRFVADAVNGRPAMRFANDGYLEGPAIFPTGTDYTLYVVMNWTGQAASNNLVSGTSHALYLASSPFPRLLHNGNFSQQAISSLPVSGPTVIRATYEHATGAASIAVNNAVADESAVPQNMDSTLFIGSYARGNFFWGDIAEVIIYDRQLDSADRVELEEELHTRYGITREPDPLPPLVQWEVAPGDNHFVPEGGSIVLRGSIIDDRVRRLDIRLDSSGIEVDQWLVETATTSTIDIHRTVSPGLHTYRAHVTAYLNDETVRTVLKADEIVSGIAFAIEGQSNSIFGDATQAPSLFARTFGSNNGRTAGDTVFKRSVSTGNGGGANVGAWGLRLQNLMASELGMPSCAINGGVGGTRIELHFPNDDERMSLNSIYGSWLYRLEKSGLREHIRWLFWYQGESNSGADGYAELFGTLYKAWKEDLPNLEQVIVVQIRPGCGGTEHAILRDDQRRLQDLYDDVIVHTACALPGHDGCHFQSAGYRQLGDQLFRIYRDLEDGAESSVARAPTVDQVRQDVTTGDISITMKYATALLTTGTITQPLLASAFFFNGDEALHPDSVWIRGNTVILRPPDATTPVTVSYIPSKNDATTNALYDGLWLTDEVGVGALTFHDLPVIPSAVREQSIAEPAANQVVRRGETIVTSEPAHKVTLTSMVGVTWQLTGRGDHWAVPRSMAPGVYAMTVSGMDGVVQTLLYVAD